MNSINFFFCFSGLYFSFGYGRLYQEKNNNIKLNDGVSLFMCADKSVRFIEGNQSTGLVPALVLDGMVVIYYYLINLLLLLF